MPNYDPWREFAILRQRYAKIQTLPNTTTASTGVCLAAEWPEPLHECLQLQGNQIRSKTELPDLCRCGRACPRSAAHEILGERQRRWWGLFWWRGSINIALLPPRLLVCLSRTSTVLHHTPHYTTHHTPHHKYNARHHGWRRRRHARLMAVSDNVHAALFFLTLGSTECVIIVLWL